MLIETAPLDAATSVTVAVAEPPGPVAVTDAVVTAGIVAGAENRPDELIVPAVVLQLVAPVEVNCSVFPRITVADEGVIVWAAVATRVMTAVADPFVPAAVTVTDGEAGIVDGAV